MMRDRMMRDKFLTEAMGGRWCGGIDGCDIDFSTWEDFGELWEWAQEQEWWADVVRWDFYTDEEGITHGANFIQEGLIHPNHFADAIYEYLKGVE